MLSPSPLPSPSSSSSSSSPPSPTNNASASCRSTNSSIDDARTRQRKPGESLGATRPLARCCQHALVVITAVALSTSSPSG
eukprot:1193452-Prorocentrum_minimum.AAC.1